LKKRTKKLLFSDKTVAQFGQLDVLVNNAGTANPKLFEEATLEELNPAAGPEAGYITGASLTVDGGTNA
jgi:NAD(P)-dependent dehydrogenase (short-subunit alcohol dehydrogenase family)